MLIKFEVENFRSFKSRKIFHTIQRNFKRFSHHIYKHHDKLSLLKTSGIYGGNASGKTNLFKAIYFVHMLAIDADFLVKQKASKILSPFRLNKTAQSNISMFEIDFISNNNIYVYRLAIDCKSKKILSENLLKLTDNYEEPIFNRFINSENKTELQFHNKDLMKLNDVLTKVLPGHTSILSFDLIEHEDLINVRDWFKNKIKFLFPVYEFNDIAYILSKKKEYLELANRIIKFSKTGIDHIRVDSVPIDIYLGSESIKSISRISSILEERDYYPFKDAVGNFCTAVRNDKDEIVVLKLVSVHLDDQNNKVEFELDQESRGTIVLLHLLPALILSYGEGVNYFIDEINASLHPILLKEILSQYLEYNLGAAKGQLIFNSHEDFIMDEKIIRQDELWLVEKDKSGETDIFPLSNIENVRFDLNLRKNYLNGKFGGVPFDEKPEKLLFDVKN